MQPVRHSRERRQAAAAVRPPLNPAPVYPPRRAGWLALPGSGGSPREGEGGRGRGVVAHLAPAVAAQLGLLRGGRVRAPWWLAENGVTASGVPGENVIHVFLEMLMRGAEIPGSHSPGVVAVIVTRCH